MDRRESFRDFMGQLRTIPESLDAMPDLPDGLGVEYLERVLSDMPAAEDPYESSSILEGRLKVWDSVYLPMPKAVSLAPKRPRDMSSLRSINAEWEKTKETLSMVGRPDGVHYLRPKGKYILDMMNDDIRMLQGAHILAHRCPADPARDEYTFGQLSGAFIGYLVKLFVARLYGLKVKVRPEPSGHDSFSLYGIDVAVSTDLRSPVMVEPIGSAGMVPNETVAVVLGSVGIEAHPSQAAKEGPVEWKEFNKWSCLPTLVALAGWECVDYIAHAEKTEAKGELQCAVPCGDLQQMSDFDWLLEKARKARGEPETSDEVMPVEDWFDSKDFEKGLSETPILPCPYCIRLNDRAEGVVRRPKSRKPRMKLKDAEASRIPEVKEWADYAKFVNRCIEIGRCAVTHALKSVTTVKRRNAAFKRKMERMGRLARLAKLHLKKVTSGFITDAELLMVEINKLKEAENGSGQGDRGAVPGTRGAQQAQGQDEGKRGEGKEKGSPEEGDGGVPGGADGA